MVEKLRSLFIGLLFFGSVVYLLVSGIAPVAKKTMAPSQQASNGAKLDRVELEERRAQLLSSVVSSKKVGPEPKAYQGMGEWGLRGRALFQVIFDEKRPKRLSAEDFAEIKKRFAARMPEAADQKTNEVRDRLGILRHLAVCFAHGKMSPGTLREWLGFMVDVAADEDQTWAVQRRAVIAMNAMPLEFGADEKRSILAKLPANVLELAQQTEEELLQSPLSNGSGRKPAANASEAAQE